MDESLIRVCPSLEIREGAIDRLVNLYKKSVYKTGVSTIQRCGNPKCVGMCASYRDFNNLMGFTSKKVAK